MMRLCTFFIVSIILWGISSSPGVTQAQESKSHTKLSKKLSSMDEKPERKMVHIRSTVDVIDPRENISDIISEMRKLRYQKRGVEHRTNSHLESSHREDTARGPEPPGKTDPHDPKPDENRKDRVNSPPTPKVEPVKSGGDRRKPAIKKSLSPPPKTMGRPPIPRSKRYEERRRLSDRPPQMHPPSPQHGHTHKGSMHK